MKILDKFSHSNKKLYIPALIIFLALVAGLITFAVVKNQPADKFVGKCRTINHHQLCTGSVIGLSEARADEYISVLGFKSVIANINGENQIISAVYSPREIYLRVDNGIVTDALFDAPNF